MPQHLIPVPLPRNRLESPDPFGGQILPGQALPGLLGSRREVFADDRKEERGPFSRQFQFQAIKFRLRELICHDALLSPYPFQDPSGYKFSTDIPPREPFHGLLHAIFPKDGVQYSPPQSRSRETNAPGMCIVRTRPWELSSRTCREPPPSVWPPAGDNSARLASDGRPPSPYDAAEEVVPSGRLSHEPEPRTDPSHEG